MRWIPATERLPEHDKIVPIKAYGKTGFGMYQENTMPKKFWYQTIDGIGTLTEDIFSRLQWLDEQSDEWISVEKELPEIYKPVLICEPPINDHDDWTMAVSYWDGTYEKINGKKLPRFPDGQDEQPGWHNAAYWELLPQPPKQ